MRAATESGPLLLFQFISLGLMIALGSAGNTLVLYALSKKLRIRRSPSLLLLGFASVDLARACLSLPVLFVAVVHPLPWSAGCRLAAFANAFCLLANQLSILGMAVDRYLESRHRALYRRCPLGLAMLLGVWGLAIFLAFPAASSSEPALLEARCTFPHHSYGSNGDASGLLLATAAAFLLTNLFYGRLFFVLRGRRRMGPVVYEPAVSDSWGFYDPRTDTPVRNRWLAHSLSIAVISSSVAQSRFVPSNHDVAMWRSKKQKEKEQLTKLCFAIHVIFSTMWAPYVGISFYLAYANSQPRNYVPQWAEISATWLTYIQLTVTPIAFCSFSHFAKNKVSLLNGKRRFSPTLSSNSSM